MADQRIGSWSDRVFHRYKQRYTPVLVGLAVTVGVAIGLLASQLPFLLAWAPVVLGLVVAIEWLALLGNGWLRDELAVKLRAVGEPADQPTARFVGLAHPCHLDTIGRRLVETDDDVGFLQVDARGIEYRGDGLSFSIPAEQIAAVRLVRSTYAPWARVEVETTDGEPFDTVIFDSRHHRRHSACRRDNRRLWHEINAAMTAGEQRSERRLTGWLQEVDEPIELGG